MIRYTCIHCGKVANLPDEKLNSIYTCPACEFSNWVAGMMVEQVSDGAAPRQGQGSFSAGQSAVPQAKPAVPQPHPGAQQAKPYVSQAAHATGPRASAPPTRPAVSKPPVPPAAPPGTTATKPPAGAVDEKRLEDWLRNPDTRIPLHPPAQQPPPTPVQKRQALSDKATSTRYKYRYPQGARNSSQKGDAQVCPEATASLLLGLAGLVFCGVPGIIAIIVGIVAKTKIARDPNRFTGGGLASAGILLGVVDMVIAFAAIGSRCR